jgi:medium-chain acyl-[acyl-carrier-protein] hydrolase
MSTNFNESDCGDGFQIEKIYTIPVYDLDMKYSTTMPVLCNYFYDIGLQHAAILTKDFESLPEGVVFVVTRYQVRVDRYPLLNEKILIKSWLSPVEHKHVVRNFLLLDESGKIFGRAINSATTFNLHKRAGEDLTGSYDLSMIKTLTWEPALPHVFAKIPDVASPVYENKIEVRYFDCDFYQHVNNVKYVEWCIETLPVEFLKKHRLYEIDISFKKESSIGDKLIVKTCAGSEDNTFIHSITNEESGKDVVRMKSIWK